MPLKNIKGENKIIGSSQSLTDTMDLALKAAMTNSSVFLKGESGVGKELFAKFIQQNSLRHEKPFIIINCATISENMSDSELFGHKKWAFTDAKEKGVGKFEAANGGTIFLDEIGDLSLNVQAKLLRVLQEREIVRIGENYTIKIDVRIIAATNKDIPKLIKEGKFREDLFFRFNTIPLEIPPLRDRLKDLPELAEHILFKKDKKCRFHEKTLNLLKQHLYTKSNVRELEGIIEFAIILAGDDLEIKPEHIRFSYYPRDLFELAIDRSNLNMERHVTPLLKILIYEAMHKHNGVKTNAAKELGIKSFLLDNLIKSLNESLPQTSSQYLHNFRKHEKKVNRRSDQSPIRHQKPELAEKLDYKSQVIIEMVRKNGWVTNKMVQKELEISRSTAKRLLLSLLEQRILRKEGNGRSFRYILF